MNEENKENQSEQQPQPDDGAQEEAQSEAEQQVAQDIQETMDALQKERDELEHRLMRTAADYQNYVKRSEQNRRTAEQQQLMDVGKSLVTVLDHFDRALEVDPEQTTAKDVLAGVQMVHDELIRTLQRFGVERIDVQAGEPFDPNRHEALMRELREDIESNHVTQQLQPGYVIDDKVVRPAKVAVAE